MGSYKLQQPSHGDPVHMNQHQSWLMRNEKYYIDFGSILDMFITFKSRHGAQIMGLSNQN